MKQVVLSNGISRRKFIGGMAALGALGAAGLSSCSQPASEVSGGIEEKNQDATPDNIVETLECDIIVVGAGISGLACAVQAAQEGNKVILLEKAGTVGGNGMGTEGVFAIGSSYQIEQGIDIKPYEIVHHELESAQWRLDGSIWVNMAEQSADNIQWLEDNGVQFSGVVDNYHTGVVKTMHWFKENAGGVSYVPQMQSAAEALGVEIRTSTTGTSLIMDGKTITGLYAVNSDGESIQINAPVVVLASGGIGANKEILAKMDIWTPERLENMIVGSVPTVNGDGYAMAMETGAKSVLGISSLNCFNGIKALSSGSFGPPLGPAAGGFPVWVNQEGKRFNDESIAFTQNMNAQATAVMSCREAYSLFDQTYVDMQSANEADAKIIEEAFVDANKDSVCKADTLEELAENFSVNPEALVETVEKYNSYCDAGEDNDFGKPGQFLMKIATPPFYMCKIVNFLIAVNGGISTDVNGRVVDADMMPIDGLYAIGMDGIMLWRSVAVQAVPGTATGGGVNFGRNAARHATKYISSLS